MHNVGVVGPAPYIRLALGRLGKLEGPDPAHRSDSSVDRCGLPVHHVGIKQLETFALEDGCQSAEQDCRTRKV